MKKFFFYGLVLALFSMVLVGCGGGSTPTVVDGVDPNAPIAKLDPTRLNIEFD